MIRVICRRCGNVLLITEDIPYSLECQICGSRNGSIEAIRDLEFGKDEGVSFECLGCNSTFPLPLKKIVELRCPKCKKKILKLVGKGKISGEQDSEEIPSIEAPSMSSKIKVVIPYYGGNLYVDRAVKTWIYPEVVFALTDQGIIPPGHGVCSQFFCSRNARKIGIVKTKPFLKDVLEGMLNLFPDEDYYGYFNSDIILPLGKNIHSLAPVQGFDIVFHHRQNVVGEGDIPVRRLIKHYPEHMGKDGFVVKKHVLKEIINSFPDVILGAPAWDDTLMVWLWDRFGRDKMEIRYGEVWHVWHTLRWDYKDVDARYNFAVLGRNVNKIAEVDMEKLYREELHKRTKIVNFKKYPILGIIQPGRLGDVLLVLPIAKWYFDQGWDIVWPIGSEFIQLFDYVSYVKPVEITNCQSLYFESRRFLEQEKVDRIIDLGIGFGRREDDWISSGLHFDEWKYKEAQVPFEERYNLKIDRDFQKESKLQEIVRQRFKLDGQPFEVIHEDSSAFHYNWKRQKAVKLTKHEGFTILDWFGILENCKEIFCVDSCIATMVNQLGLCKGRRTVHYFDHSIHESNPKRRELITLKLSEDWKVI